MAVTKIWPVKGKADAVIDYASNITKTSYTEDELKALSDVIDYASDGSKTEKKIFVSGINCSPDYAKDQFKTTKKRFSKEGGTVAFHGYQSFAPGEANPKLAHDIGVAMAKELWGNRFQVIVATHVDRSHLHNHYVINSISFKDGKRFHSTAASYHQLKEVSDRLCKEHGLSIIEEPKGKGLPYKYYQMEKAGMPTRYNAAKDALDEAIERSCNLHELRANLNSMGYQCQFAPNRKYWTITLPGWKKPIRTYRLGEDYSRENIERRVYSNNESARQLRIREGYKRRPQYTLRRRIDKIMGRSGLEKLYLRYCYELGYLPKYTQKPSKVHARLKDELLKCDMYSEEAKLLAKNNISTNTELCTYKEKLEEVIKAFEKERATLRKQAKNEEPEKATELSEEADGITEDLKALRKELKLCRDIEERSPKLKENIMQITKERPKEVQR